MATKTIVSEKQDIFMSAQQRRELKNNELAGFLEQLPDFFRKYSNQILGICLILIALVVIPVYKRMRQRNLFYEQADVVSKIQTARESITASAQGAKGALPGSLLSTAAMDLKTRPKPPDNQTWRPWRCWKSRNCFGPSCIFRKT